MANKKGLSHKKNARKIPSLSKPVDKNPDVYSYKSSSEPDDASSLPATKKYLIPTKAMNTSILPSDLSSILKVGTDPNEDDDLDEFDRPLHSTALEEEHEMSDQSLKISPPKKRRNLKNDKNEDLIVKKSTKHSEKENVQTISVRKTLLVTSANLVKPVPSLALKSIRTTPQSKHLQNERSDPQDEEMVHSSGNIGHVAKKSKKTLTLLEPSLPPTIENSARKAPKRKQFSKTGTSLMEDAVTTVQGVQSGASANLQSSPQRPEDLSSPDPTEKSKKTLTLLEPSLPPAIKNSARKAPKRKPFSKTGPSLMEDAVTTVQDVQSGTSANLQSSPQRPEELSSPDPTEEGTKVSEEVPKGKKRKVLHENNENCFSRDIAHGSDVSVAMWCPDGTQRSSRDITELDIILAEFTNIITKYKREAESVKCINAIDSFFSAFKEQLTKTIEEVQKLKNLQRKNTKVISGIAKARKCLITVKDELLVTEPQLKQLQKEYIQLGEKVDSLKISRQFLNDLTELKKDYVEYRKKDPKEIEKYGVSSLPALLLESRSILSAEKHLHTINSKLQQFLDQDSATKPTDSETL